MSDEAEIRLSTYPLLAVGLPALAAIVVALPYTWVRGYQVFGFNHSDHIAYTLPPLLALVALGFSVRAYLRVRRGGQSRLRTWFVNMTPLLILAGVGFGVFMAQGVEKQRMRSYTERAETLCAHRFCPGEKTILGDAMVRGDLDCARQNDSFEACLQHAWRCQREMAGLELDEESRAEVRCLRNVQF